MDILSLRSSLPSQDPYTQTLLQGGLPEAFSNRFISIPRGPFRTNPPSHLGAYCISEDGGDLSTPTTWERPVKVEEEDSGSCLCFRRTSPGLCTCGPQTSREGVSLMHGTGARGSGVTGTKGAVRFGDGGGFPFLTGQVGRIGLGIPGLSSDGPGRKATVAGDERGGKGGRACGDESPSWWKQPLKRPWSGNEAGKKLVERSSMRGIR